MKLVAVVTVAFAMVAFDVPAGATLLKRQDPAPAMLRAGDGKLVPVTRPRSLGDGDWVNVEYPQDGQRRMTMQLQVECATPDANAAGVTSMVTAALMSTHCVRLYDPALRRSGSGPKYILGVRITEYEMRKSGHGIGGLGSGLISRVTHSAVEGASIERQKAEIGLTVELVSASTGEVLRSTELKGKSSSLRMGLSGVSVAGVTAGELGTWSNPAMAQAARIAAAKLAYRVFDWTGTLRR